MNLPSQTNYERSAIIAVAYYICKQIAHSMSNHPECPTSPTPICLKFDPVVWVHKKNILVHFFFGQHFSEIRVGKL